MQGYVFQYSGQVRQNFIYDSTTFRKNLITVDFDEFILPTSLEISLSQLQLSFLTPLSPQTDHLILGLLIQVLCPTVIFCQLILPLSIEAPVLQPLLLLLSLHHP